MKTSILFISGLLALSVPARAGDSLKDTVREGCKILIKGARQKAEPVYQEILEKLGSKLAGTYQKYAAERPAGASALYEAGQHFVDYFSLDPENFKLAQQVFDLAKKAGELRKQITALNDQNIETEAQYEQIEGKSKKARKMRAVLEEKSRDLKNQHRDKLRDLAELEKIVGDLEQSFRAVLSESQEYVTATFKLRQTDQNGKRADDVAVKLKFSSDTRRGLVEICTPQEEIKTWGEGQHKLRSCVELDLTGQAPKRVGSDYVTYVDRHSMKYDHSGYLRPTFEYSQVLFDYEGSYPLGLKKNEALKQKIEAAVEAALVAELEPTCREIAAERAEATATADVGSNKEVTVGSATAETTQTKGEVLK